MLLLRLRRLLRQRFRWVLLGRVHRLLKFLRNVAAATRVSGVQWLWRGWLYLCLLQQGLDGLSWLWWLRKRLLLLLFVLVAGHLHLLGLLGSCCQQ